MEKNKACTIHTSRTLMFKELERVMDYVGFDGNYGESLAGNIINKQSRSNMTKTIGYLRTLYGFDTSDSRFQAFRHFWDLTDADDKPKLAFVFAIGRDSLLAESIDVVRSVSPGNKVPIESFETNLDRYHPNRFSPNTKRSVAQNIASSWKQAGFIEGKVKNIRFQPRISFKVAAFAFLQAYLMGERGDYIWANPGVRALCLPDQGLRDLAIESTKRDLLHYQYAGEVTVLSFTNIMTKIGIDGNKD